MGISAELAGSLHAPLEIPPPLPRRPVQWRRARQLVGEIIDDPRQTEKVFELLEAVGGRGDEVSFQRFATHPHGRRLLIERPSLHAVLADREALASLPEGSLGRAYLDFARRSGIDAEGLLTANESALGHLNRELDPHRLWFFQRANLAHDLWHVLSGYETDEVGEASLLAFSIGQGLANRALKVLLFVGGVLAPWRNGFAFQRYLIRAWRRGRRASPLFVARYEELLRLPLAEVRRMLDIEAPQVAHPEGFYRGSRRADGLTRVPASAVI